MQYSLLRFLFFLLLINLVGCNNDNPNLTDQQLDDNETNMPRTAEDVKTDFANIDFKPGINDISLESTTEDFYWNFRVIVPENASNANKKPLIFSLHGGAQNISPDMHKNTDCLISPGLDGIIDAFIVSPNSNGELWYEQNNLIQILALYDLITTNLPIDLDKIAVTGFSDGGNGSWFFSQFYSSLFSAAIPMATSYDTTKGNGNIEPIGIPLYVIHGNDDTLFPIETTEGFVNASIDAGSNVTFVIAAGLEHYQPCDYVTYLRDAAAWLVSDVWN
jgi:predicted peptidase